MYLSVSDSTLTKTRKASFRHMLRKGIALLLLFIFWMNGMGYYLLFPIAQQWIKKEIKRELKSQIPTEKLHLIVVDANNREQVKWLNKGEFFYQHLLYDVVKAIHQPHRDAYYCLIDQEETQLYSILDRLVADHLKRHGQVKWIKKLTKALFCLLLFNPWAQALPITEKNRPIAFCASTWKTIQLEIPAPPPKIS